MAPGFAPTQWARRRVAQARTRTILSLAQLGHPLWLHSLCMTAAAADHVLCSANAGVTSNSANLWHTFAHEVTHAG